MLTFLQLEGNRGPPGWWDAAAANVKAPPRSFSLLCAPAWCPRMASDPGKILPMLLPLSHKIMFLHVMHYEAFCCVWLTACRVKRLLVHNDDFTSMFKLDPASDLRVDFTFRTCFVVLWKKCQQQKKSSDFVKVQVSLLEWFLCRNSKLWISYLLI